MMFKNLFFSLCFPLSISLHYGNLEGGILKHKLIEGGEKEKLIARIHKNKYLSIVFFFARDPQYF